MIQNYIFKNPLLLFKHFDIKSPFFVWQAERN
jgi:hypothetical protein